MDDHKKKEPGICVIGSSNMDLLTKVRRLPMLGETLIGKRFHMGFGGKGANQAIMAAMLGARVTMVTKLGEDFFGELTYKNYQEHGVDTRYIHWSKENTGVASIFVDDEGNNFISIVPGANWDLSIEDVRADSEAIELADVVICQLEVPLETVVEAMKIARRGEAITILNPAPACALPDEIFGLCDLIVPNEIEAGSIMNMPIDGVEDAKKCCKKLFSFGGEAAIITIGEEGAVIGDREGVLRILPPAVNAVDSTGAGDAFMGTLAYYAALGWSLREAVLISNIAAALSVTRIGTQVSFPSKEEVEDGYFGGWEI